MRQEILMIPGPTPVPPQVVKAMGQSMISHRGGEFSELFYRIQRNLQQVFCTNQEVLVFPAAGTGAMEAVLVNLFSPGDRILLAETGEFGQRFGKMACVFGLDVDSVPAEVGKGLDPERLIQKMSAEKMKPYRGLLVTHNETATGVCNPLQKLGKWCSDHDVQMVVDAVSSLGGLPLKMDEWGLDAVVSASQKALMTPPGLAFVCLSQRAWQKTQTASLPRVYWDLTTARIAAKKGQTPYTPALSLLYGLDKALEMILEEGLNLRWDRHRIGGKSVRAAIESLGLQAVASDPYASDTVTAVWIPTEIGAEQVRKNMKDEFAVVVAGGQSSLAGKIIRIGHMGFTSYHDILKCIHALEGSVARGKTNTGQGVKTARAVMAKEGVMVE